MVATIIALFILASLAIFQLALALGAPLGRFAWGGKHTVLPTKLRISSVVAIGIYALFAIIITNKAGLLNIFAQGIFLEVAMQAVIVYLAIGVVMNALSRSKAERYTMTPISLVLLVCFGAVAFTA